MTAQPRPPAETSARLDRWLPLVAGVLALLPLVAYHGLFNRLFWYADEFDLIDQFDQQGFWHWTWLVFAENFVPLFKVLWAGAILLFHGSYAAMITVLWLTHALNVGLLGRLMRTCGLPWMAVAAAQMAFGLTAANYETLAWSVQWSAVLSTTFMLLALEGFFRAPFRAASFGGSLASALSFSRGVLTGPLLALASLWPGEGAAPSRFRSRAAFAAGYLAPAVAVAVLISLFASGNHHHMAGHVGDAALYAAWYYCLNPAHQLFSIGSMDGRTVALLGLGKLALVGWALLRSRDRPRLLFVLLVLFDLGNAALLGIGRYHTGLPTTVSSRYQYAPLVAMAPLAGFWIARLWDRIPGPRSLRSAVAAAALAVGALFMLRQWPRELESFTDARGTQSRRILLTDPHPAPHAVPGVPWMETDRAKALIARYNLH
jgi:hypothetical protein